MAKWDILPNETVDEYEMFTRYRAQTGTRSISKAIAESTDDKALTIPGEPVSKIALSKWMEVAERHIWRDRARAWDQHIAKVQTELEQEAIIDMTRRHIEQSLVIQKAALGYFIERDEDGNPLYEYEITDSGERIKRFKIRAIEDANTAGRLWRQSVQMERLARGLPTEYWAMQPDALQKRHQELVEALNADDPDDDNDMVEGWDSDPDAETE